MVGYAGLQKYELFEVAVTKCQLANLVAGDRSGLFRRRGLNRRVFRRHFHGCARLARFQRDIEGVLLCDIEDDVVGHGRLEPSALDRYGVTAGRKIRDIETSATVGTPAPLGSVTVPVRVAASSCVRPAADRARMATQTARSENSARTVRCPYRANLRSAKFVRIPYVAFVITAPPGKHFAVGITVCPLIETDYAI